MDIISQLHASADALNKTVAPLQEFVDNAQTRELTEVLVFYHHLREAHEALDNARKAVNKRVEAMNKFTVPTMLEDAGLDKVQVPQIARSFYPLTKISCSMLDKDKGMLWLRERGAGSLISETVNAGTLAAYMKDLVVEEGVDPPEDIFKLSAYKITGISKYTPKG